MKPRVIGLAALCLIALSATSFAQTKASTAQREVPNFEIRAACRGQVAEISIVEPKRKSSIAVGAISKDRAQTAATTSLLSDSAKMETALELLMKDGFTVDGQTADQASYEISECLGVSKPSTPRAVDCNKASKTCVCYEDENTDCSIFNYLCTVTGGQSGHNICTW